MDEDLREDVLVVVRQKSATRPWFEPSDSLQGLLNFIDGLAGAAGDFRDAAFAQGIHKITDDPVFETFLLARALELQHETFPQIPATNTRRIEALNDF